MPRDSSDYLDWYLAIAIPGPLRKTANRYYDLDIRYAVVKTLGISVRQAVFAKALLLARSFLFFGRLSSFYDYVKRAKAGDLLLGSPAGAFADGQHCDNGCDTKDYAQDSEYGAKTMEP